MAGLGVSFADDNNAFALGLYGQLRQQPGNLLISPLSVRLALGMAYAGARGETAAQIRDALRVSSSDEALHLAFAETIQHLNAAGGGRYEMAVANALWGRDGAPLQPGFVDLIARHYEGSMNVADFRHGAEAARVAMNQWVEEKTRHRIRDLIPPGGLDAATRMVLVNAVYFKGTWVLQFPKEFTRDEPFYLEGGGTVRAPLMLQEDDVGYLHGDGYQALDLAYRGNDLSMLVLLPDRKDGLRDLEKRLSARMIHDCVAQMSAREVTFLIPRFKIVWGTTDLTGPLTALGMPLAFSRVEADFSGINGQAPPRGDWLFISAVLHKTFVEVNEEGTEAAATTASIMFLGSVEPTPPVPIVRADHPFLFAIRDRRTGAILFLGRMADPTREN